MMTNLKIDMITLSNIHNLLTHRGLTVVPPPISSATYCNVEATASNKAHIHALLHKVYTSCSRVFLFLLITLPFAFASCDSEQTVSYEELVQYHAESLNLPAATADSIYRFSKKVTAFVSQHPDAKTDPLYPQIEENIHAAATKLNLDFSTWKDEGEEKEIKNGSL